VFAERLHGVTKEYARRTNRQKAALEDIGFALGGEAGSRLAAQLGFSISSDTLLRYIRSAPDPEVSVVAVLGVDDWAWRRRLRYGTILVDLERHRVIDLLPGRSSVSFAQWLLDHREVGIISRDRGGEYREGASRGAPGAVQVADRFHLIKNFSESILKVFMRHVSLLSRVLAPDSPRMLSPPRPDREASRERTRGKIAERNETIHSMANKGMSKSAIARALGLKRQTVGKYLRAEAVPDRPRRSGTSGILTPYEGYILERCRQGYWNAMGLWREIVELGYSGEYKSVSRLVAYLRKMSGDGMDVPAPVELMTPRKTVGLLLRRPEDRSASQRSTIVALIRLDPEIERAVQLFEWFARLVRRQPNEKLEEWLRCAEGSGIVEIKRFVTKLRQDLDAVLAGMSLPWSQGQTEGQVTKLKLIRRQMYGRGNFDLLRKRVLRAA
jgi:transposase